MIRVAYAAALMLLGAQAGADTLCVPTDLDGKRYTICTVPLDAYRIDLHLRAPSGELLGSFAMLEAQTGPATIAMNAGMYHEDRRPVGLYIENAVQEAPLVTRAGPGNFGMLPNGVFCIGSHTRVIESTAYEADPPDCLHATQSGPMLVIGGQLHPRFLPDSDSRNIRNGVAVSPDGTTAYFVISDTAVTFHEFATVFRDHLGVADALYLDGRVSKLHHGPRSDQGRAMGPILAVRPR